MNRANAGAHRIAAFFDIDGTILAEPSLERRYVAALRRSGAIPARNYLSWLAGALKLAPHGLRAIAHTNKMYLCGLSSVQAFSKWGPHPRLFPHALNQIARHAKCGHAIFFITGTLAPLASNVAMAAILRLAVRGIPAAIGVCATQLGQVQGRWTGRIVGEPVFAQGKARAMWRLAASTGIDLQRSYAYANSAADRWMLGAVGRPAAVNPSRQLARIASLRGWPVLCWRDGDNNAKNADAFVTTDRFNGVTGRTAVPNSASEILG